VRGCIRRTRGGSPANPQREPGLRRAARGIGLAVGEELVERALGVAGGKEGQPHVGRRHAVEDHRAYAVAVLADVDEGGTRAVGAAIQVDALVAEMGAHVVQVVHRDGRRVEPDVGFVAGQTRLQPLERLVIRFGGLAQRTGVGPAVQRIRFARPALVDEHDVAVLQHLPEDVAHLTRELCRALPGATRQEEQRVRMLAAAERGQQHDVEADAAAGLRLPVLEHLQGPAIGVNRPLVTRAGTEPLERRHSGRGGARRGECQREKDKERSDVSVQMPTERGASRQRSR
jgi:hypothetical protein